MECLDRIGRSVFTRVLLSKFAFAGGAAAGNSRLRDAAKKHDLKTVASLIGQHVDVSARADDGSTALLWAASATATGTHGPPPTLLLGESGMGLKGGSHLVDPEHTPLTNLQLTLLNKLGIPAEKLGDSNRQFKELSDLS